MTTIDINVSPALFNPVYIPHLDNMSRTQIFFGGSSSGKSVFMADRCIYDVLGGKRNYLICRQVARTIRKSVFTEIEKAIRKWGVDQLFSVNKSEMLITCANGYQIMFGGLDDVEKIKSMTPAQGAITDIWIEEATEADPETIKQLYKRQRGGDDRTPKRLVMTFNPILKLHHIYKTYFAPVAWSDNQTEYTSDDLSILKTTYKDNRFLTPGDIADLENESDEYFYNVYTLGNWGTLGDVIFTNWETADLSDIKGTFDNIRMGLDFGFSSDPAAMVVTHYDASRKTIYIFDEVYEHGLVNAQLADVIKPLIGWGHVVADSSEPKSIAEMQMAGVNMIGAKKGKDSVLHGIQWLQGQRIIIDRSCINAINEFSFYQWAKDKDGNSLPRPVDKMNHLIDALRYAYEDAMHAGDLVLFGV